MTKTCGICQWWDGDRFCDCPDNGVFLTHGNDTCANWKPIDDEIINSEEGE